MSKQTVKERIIKIAKSADIELDRQDVDNVYNLIDEKINKGSFLNIIPIQIGSYISTYKTSSAAAADAALIMLEKEHGEIRYKYLLRDILLYQYMHSAFVGKLDNRYCISITQADEKFDEILQLVSSYVSNSKVNNINNAIYDIIKMSSLTSGIYDYKMDKLQDVINRMSTMSEKDKLTIWVYSYKEYVVLSFNHVPVELVLNIRSFVKGDINYFYFVNRILYGKVNTVASIMKDKMKFIVHDDKCDTNIRMLKAANYTKCLSLLYNSISNNLPSVCPEPETFAHYFSDFPESDGFDTLCNQMILNEILQEE